MYLSFSFKHNVPCTNITKLNSLFLHKFRKNYSSLIFWRKNKYKRNTNIIIVKEMQTFKTTSRFKIADGDNEPKESVVNSLKRR